MSRPPGGAGPHALARRLVRVPGDVRVSIDPSSTASPAARPSQPSVLAASCFARWGGLPLGEAHFVLRSRGRLVRFAHSIPAQLQECGFCDNHLRRNPHDACRPSPTRRL